MIRTVGTLFVLVLAMFALPPLVQTIESLMIPLILVVFFISLTVFLFGRRRRW